MARFRLDIEYEGTRYSGWQAQQNARTVQGELLGAIRKVLKKDDFELYGSGRTDSGVHALQQVAHLEAQTALAPEIMRRKINDELPADINIRTVDRALHDFHARHSAVARSYLYMISRRRSAFGKRYVWWIKDELNAEAMQQAAQLLKGKADFTSFAEFSPDTRSTVVAIEECRWYEIGDLLIMRIVAPRFLWKMVRRIVGVMAHIGRGEEPIDLIPYLLNNPSDLPATLTAPPSGLFLERVYYKGEQKEFNEPSPASLFL